MRIQLVFWNLGRISLILGVSMLLPIICSLYYQSHDLNALLLGMAVNLIVGAVLMLLFKKSRKQSLRLREGFALVTFAWILAAVLSTIPYLASGVCTNFFDAFFESVSGYTTTGASILTDVEIVPQGVMMWRCLTHWLGGMGIVVLLLVFTNNGGSVNLYKAEAPGNSLTDKIVPRISHTSQILWITYLIMTIVMIILLLLGGMNLFDSICHTFGTVATGGFSVKNASVGYYDSAYIQWVIIIFMFFAGSNFAFFYMLFIKRKNEFLHNEEFRVYFFIVLAAVALITLNLLQTNFYDGKSLEYIIRQAAFQVTTIITTTGFATTDFNLWPAFSKIVLFTLFFIGGCTGSTSGSIKVARIIVAVKNSFIELFRSVHPKVVRPVRINGKAISSAQTSGILQFIFIFFVLVFIGGLVLSFTGMDMLESFSAAATCLGNVGPGFGAVGPASNFSAITDGGKFLLSIYMLIGRLELFTVLVLFMPTVWKK